MIFGIDAMMVQSDSLSGSPGRRCGAILALIALVGIVLCATPVVFAESLVLRETPNLTLLKEGAVHVVAKSPDGGLVLAGDFRYFDGVRVDGLARLDAQGNVDPGWLPANPGRISALAVSETGDVFVAGFAEDDSSYLMKIGPSGQLVPGWVVTADAWISGLLVDDQGRVLVSGYFSSIAGQPVGGLVALDPHTGGFASNWTPWNGAQIRIMRAGPGSSIYVAHMHSSGAGSMGLTRLSSDGVPDLAWSPMFDDAVNVLAVAPDGSAFVAGNFSHVNGVLRHSLAKVMGTGSGALDASWSPAADWLPPYEGNQFVNSMDIDNDGAVYVAGRFSSIGGESRSGLAKLDGHGTGVSDPAWVVLEQFESAFNHLGFSNILIQAGEVQVSGQFRSFPPGVISASAVRLDRDTGELLRAQQAGAPGAISVMLRQSNGGTVLFGDFLQADGWPRRNLLRLDADHQVDPAWSVDLRGTVHTMADDGAGGILVGGVFNVSGEPGLRNLIRLAGDGHAALDEGWLPDPDGRVLSIDVSDDGYAYVGGGFLEIGGIDQSFLARVDLDTGQPDHTWRPNVENTVSALKLDGLGRLYANHRGAGSVWQGLWRYPTSGSGDSDPSWYVISGVFASSMRFDAGGDLIVAGTFPAGLFSAGTIALYPTAVTGNVSQIWGLSYGRDMYGFAVSESGYIYAIGGGFGSGSLIRIQPYGTLDAGFSTPMSGSSRVVDIDESGILYVGGSLGDIQGQERFGLAAFDLRVDLLFADGFE